jgi:hypothetical protein
MCHVTMRHVTLFIAQYRGIRIQTNRPLSSTVLPASAHSSACTVPNQSQPSLTNWDSGRDGAGEACPGIRQYRLYIKNYLRHETHEEPCSLLTRKHLDKRPVSFLIVAVVL